MELKPEDISISTFSSRQRGGWDTTPDNGVRLTHRPTGISVEESGDRSAHRNKANAFARLEELVKNAEPLPGVSEAAARVKAYLDVRMPAGLCSNHIHGIQLGEKNDLLVSDLRAILQQLEKPVTVSIGGLELVQKIQDNLNALRDSMLKVQGE